MAAITGRQIERIRGRSHKERGNAKAKSHVAIRLITKNVENNSGGQYCESRTMVEVPNAETSADCIVMGDYNWSLRSFFFFFLAAGYSISCQRRNCDISDVLPLHAPLRPLTDSSDRPADRQQGSRV